MTPELACYMCPVSPKGNVRANLPFVLAGLAHAGLTDPLFARVAVATIRAETEGWLPIPEGISKYNTEPDCEPFNLYDNRRDLGNRGHPDGFTFRGRGYVQLTGRDNYRVTGKALNLPLETQPDLALNPSVAGLIIGAFIKRHSDRIAKLALANDTRGIRKLVNGGGHGLKRFEDAWNRWADATGRSLYNKSATETSSDSQVSVIGGRVSA